MKLTRIDWLGDKLWYRGFRILVEVMLVLAVGGGAGFIASSSNLVGSADDFMFFALGGYLVARVGQFLVNANWSTVSFYLLAAWLVTFGGSLNWYFAKETARERLGQDQFVTQPDSFTWTVVDNRHLDR